MIEPVVGVGRLLGSDEGMIEPVGVGRLLGSDEGMLESVGVGRLLGSDEGMLESEGALENSHGGGIELQSVKGSKSQSS
jgi:hypothetical protein